MATWVLHFAVNVELRMLSVNQAVVVLLTIVASHTCTFGSLFSYPNNTDSTILVTVLIQN
ncbi:hypothetical protein [Pinibacter soli]|uniref:Uncharacterized protein n=1 Tax=Pinibacter soli TaxID=3044211 RepID=A0ABT6RHB6_9BACT|nr:hypothetical protein [Pinibacter soli]MDI3321227.1 hypothetical protein [Pinibacter soli]